VSTIWAKVPKTVTKLGHAPGITNTQPVPGNSTQAPTWFVPTAPDLGYLFNVLLPKGLGPQYKKTVNTPTRIVTPTPEISVIRARVRTYLRVAYSDFDLTPKVTDATVTVKTFALAPYTVIGESGAFDFQGEAIAMELDRGVSAESGEFLLAGGTVNFVVPSRTIFCANGTFGATSNDLLLLHLDQPNSVTDTHPLSSLVVDGGIASITGFYNLNFSGGPTFFGAAYYTKIPVFGSNHVYLENNDYPYLEYDIGTPLGYDDFTIDMWVIPQYVQTTTQAVAVLGSGTEYASDGSGPWSSNRWGTGLYIQSNKLRYLAVDNDLVLRTKIEHQIAIDTVVWRHIAIERYNGVVRIYVNGQVSSTSYDDSARYLPYSKMVLFSRGGSIGLGTQALRASVDEVYVTAKARYQGANFTVPTVPYSLGDKFYYYKSVTADAGAYTVTGQNVALNLIQTFSVSAGAFSAAGQAATFGRVRVFTVNAGAFNVTGQAATLYYYSNVIRPAAGAFSLSGQAAGLAFNRTIQGASADCNVTGQAAFGIRGYTINADKATYTLTGYASSTIYDRGVTATNGTFTYSGQAATLRLILASSDSQYVKDNFNILYDIVGTFRMFD
jgi:hypothetical protein